MITLLTDFGTADYFVPAVKGVIFSINPQAQLTDLTHDIPAQDIAAAAFTLGACYHNFPQGTIHLAVVDPGVGSSRRGIVVEAATKSGSQFFVGPDNGIFSYVYAKEEKVRVFQIERDDLLRQPPSATFHGRDVFAPIAAHLSKGLSPESVGNEISDFVRLEVPRPSAIEGERRITGSVIHVDHFGNCITNLTERELSPEQAEQASIKLRFASQQITHFGSHFDQASRQGKLFAYLGSAGYWEIALWCDSAAEKFAISRGAQVLLEL